MRGGQGAPRWVPRRLGPLDAPALAGHGAAGGWEWLSQASLLLLTFLLDTAAPEQLLDCFLRPALRAQGKRGGGRAGQASPELSSGRWAAQAAFQGGRGREGRAL